MPGHYLPSAAETVGLNLGHYFEGSVSHDESHFGVHLRFPVAAETEYVVLQREVDSKIFHHLETVPL